MTEIARIVLVDDSDDDNVFHSRVIRRAGFAGELLVIEDAFAALAFLETGDLEPPTLILLDINMPGMSGFELAEKAAPIVFATPTTIVVMLTSSSAAADRERAGVLPVIRGYLTKPLTVETVLELLQKLAG